MSLAWLVVCFFSARGALRLKLLCWDLVGFLFFFGGGGEVGIHVSLLVNSPPSSPTLKPIHQDLQVWLFGWSHDEITLSPKPGPLSCLGIALNSVSLIAPSPKP